MIGGVGREMGAVTQRSSTQATTVAQIASIVGVLEEGLRFQEDAARQHRDHGDLVGD